MRARVCPVDPASCEPLVGWERFIRHVYDVHTAGAEEDRWTTVDRLLHGHLPEPGPAAVVPKVTASPDTAALWALGHQDETRARTLINSMTPSERHALGEKLARLMNMIWSAP
jgi:hypothetical protein